MLCPSCNAEVDLDMNYCTSCGVSLKEHDGDEQGFVFDSAAAQAFAECEVHPEMHAVNGEMLSGNRFDQPTPPSASPEKKIPWGVIGIVGAVLAMVVLIGFVISGIATPPQTLNARINVNGMVVKCDHGWKITNASDGKYIYPTNESLIYVFSDTIGPDTASKSDSEKRVLLRAVFDMGDMKVKDIADAEIDGCIAERYEVEQVIDGVTFQGYVTVVLYGDSYGGVIALAPAGSDGSLMATLKQVADEVSISVVNCVLTFEDEQGKVLGDMTVLDFGDGATADLPSEFAGSSLTVMGWTCSDSSVSIEKSKEKYTASGITGDVTFVAQMGKMWTVTFTDGRGRTLAAVEVKDGESAEKPSDPHRYGYSFAGWDADFSAVTSDLTVNATWKEEPKKYFSGTYKVGTDLPAGEYAIMSSSQAYFCVYSDIDKEYIVGNNIFSGRAYVTVYDGQVLEVSDASFMDVKDVEPRVDWGEAEGVFKVGFDIEPGEYGLAANQGGHGYYALLDSSNPDPNIIQNDIFEGQNYVYVSNGQYLELSGCKGE